MDRGIYLCSLSQLFVQVFAKAHVVLPILRGAGLIKISIIPTELLSRCPFYSAWTILSEPGTVLKIFFDFQNYPYFVPFVVSETLQSISYHFDREFNDFEKE